MYVCVHKSLLLNPLLPVCRCREYQRPTAGPSVCVCARALLLALQAYGNKCIFTAVNRILCHIPGERQKGREMSRKEGLSRAQVGIYKERAAERRAKERKSSSGKN